MGLAVLIDTPAPAQRGGPWLPWLGLGLVLGGLLAPVGATLLPGPAWLWWWWLGLPAALLAWPLAAGQPWSARILIGWAALAAGAALVPATPITLAGPPLQQRAIDVSGQVSSVWYQQRVQSLLLEPAEVHVPAGWQATRRLRVFWPAALPDLRAGDTVRVQGLWTESRGLPEVRAVNLARLEMREDGPRGWAWRATERLASHRELAQSLLLGQGQAPERNDFRQSGLMHVLAVSGMHLAIAAALGAWLMRAMGVGWTTRQGLLVGLLVGYAWLTMWSPSVQRALVMALAVIAMGMLAREPQRLATVSLAALTLMVWDPAMVNQVGYQLSLVAVLGIVTLGMELVRWRERLLPLMPWPLDRPVWRGQLWCVRATCDGMAIGVAAGLATMPVLAWHLGVVNPWGTVATLVASPPATVALWLGLPVLGFAGAWPDGPWGGLYLLLEGSLHLLALAAAWCATWPGAVLTVAPPSLLTLLLWPLLFLPGSAWWWWRVPLLLVALAAW